MGRSRLAGGGRAWVLAIGVLVGACGSDRAEPPPPAGDPTFAAIHSGILERTCAVSACHSGAAPAAKLDFQLTGGNDLVKLCQTVVRRTSCLFPDKVLIVPAKPEGSFLVDKLHVERLAGVPDPSCSSTNERMPMGLPALEIDQLDQIEEWVRLGAPCGGPPIDGGMGGGSDVPADILTIAAGATRIIAGGRTQVTVTLSGPAPSAGQNVILTVTDPTVLEVPPAVPVAAGASVATFEVVGKRPAGPTELTAEAGINAMSLSIDVTGLALAEVLYLPGADEANSEWIEISNSSTVPIDLGAYSLGSGRANYTATKVQLSGTLQPGACFVIGGPASNAGNRNPTYGQVANFSPDLLNGSGGDGQATGYALFNASVDEVALTSIPIDAVLCGQNNGAGLLGSDGQPAVPGCPDVSAAGHSVGRTSVTTWVDQATPTPGICTPITL
jgi:hypothetical protein